MSLASGVVPSDWKSANVVFKNGDVFDVVNYRPVSPLPLISMGWSE